MIKKIGKFLHSLGLKGLMVSFVVWLFLALYTGSMSPISQVEHIVRDVKCKYEGQSLEWEAGSRGCVRVKFRFIKV